MTWQDTLIELYNSAFLVSRAMTSVSKMTAEEAWDSPTLRVVREKLLALLASSGKTEELARAGQELSALHDELLVKERFSVQELVKLGALSAAAKVLSSQALAETDAPRALF